MKFYSRGLETRTGACVGEVLHAESLEKSAVQISRTHKFSASEVRTARFTASGCRCCPVGKKELTQKVFARMCVCSDCILHGPKRPTHVKNKQLVELSVLECARQNKPVIRKS